MKRKAFIFIIINVLAIAGLVAYFSIRGVQSEPHGDFFTFVGAMGLLVAFFAMEGILLIVLKLRRRPPKKLIIETVIAITTLNHGTKQVRN